MFRCKFYDSDEKEVRLGIYQQTVVDALNIFRAIVLSDNKLIPVLLDHVTWTGWVDE